MQSNINFVGDVTITATVKKTSKQLAKLASSEKPKTGYEVISGSCVPYYDFDFAYSTEPEQFEHQQDDIDKSIASVRTEFNDAEFHIFTAMGMNAKGLWKNSIHIIVRGVGYAKSASQIPLVPLCDPKVYNKGRQLFRLPGFTKKGEDRPFKLYDPVNKCTNEFNDEFPLSWCCSYIEGE